MITAPLYVWAGICSWKSLLAAAKGPSSWRTQTYFTIVGSLLICCFFGGGFFNNLWGGILLFTMIEAAVLSRGIFLIPFGGAALTVLASVPYKAGETALSGAVIVLSIHAIVYFLLAVGAALEAGAERIDARAKVAKTGGAK
jgi:hypothetical protein